ncbi:S1 family peptidase [Rhizohabitans arisaemae]|uniref:S1 family peptidase n=1 Tax=Rhizohabitans arisaemae TaxID=2720610 RepID=UPI0024B1EA8E|nr:S1 family peptidase [Rhizohabitans arisaemae]
MLVSPVSAASAATIAVVEVITQDPFAGQAPLDYTTAYKLEKLEERALANPGVYAVPYVSGDQLFSPVVNAAEQGAAENMLIPPPPPPPDNGTADPAAMPPPDETEKPADPPPSAPASVSAPEERESLAPQAAASMSLFLEAPLVPHSWERLEEIKDEVLELTPAVLTGAQHMVSATIHPERNQVVVEANATPPGLLAGLAARYAGAVVVHLTDATPAEPTARHNDSSPFWGGAAISTNVTANCTSGFSWQFRGIAHMVTAGHCTSMGGSARTPVTTMGTVVKDNWNNSLGTVRIDGQSVYHGDISLVEVEWPKEASARIYVGNATSSSSRAVAGMWSRRARHGDMFCSGGKATGELCNWRVEMTGVNMRYNDGTLARNVIFAKKRGVCLKGGDSGGPAYTVNSHGKVVARGINSGTGGNGSISNPCKGFFTDIRDVHEAFPGILKTG